MNNNVPKPERKPLLTFLNEVRENKQFVIPVYQRNYTWTPEKDVKSELLLIKLQSLKIAKSKMHILKTMLLELMLLKVQFVKVQP